MQRRPPPQASPHLAATDQRHGCRRPSSCQVPARARRRNHTGGRRRGGRLALRLMMCPATPPRHATWTAWAATCGSGSQPRQQLPPCLTLRGLRPGSCRPPPSAREGPMPHPCRVLTGNLSLPTRRCLLFLSQRPQFQRLPSSRCLFHSIMRADPIHQTPVTASALSTGCVLMVPARLFFAPKLPPPRAFPSHLLHPRVLAEIGLLPPAPW